MVNFTTLGYVVCIEEDTPIQRTSEYSNNPCWHGCWEACHGTNDWRDSVIPVLVRFVQCIARSALYVVSQRVSQKVRPRVRDKLRVELLGHRIQPCEHSWPSLGMHNFQNPRIVRAKSLIALQWCCSFYVLWPITHDISFAHVLT